MPDRIAGSKPIYRGSLCHNHTANEPWKMKKTAASGNWSCWSRSEPLGFPERSNRSNKRMTIPWKLWASRWT